MVKLEEVTDEHFTAPSHDEEDWDTDSESDASSMNSLDNETILERITALKDIIPARRRAQLSNALDTSQSWVGSGLSYSGKTLWVVCTSALLLGVPFMLGYADDQQMAEQEQQMRMQQTASEFLTPGAQTPGESKAAL